MENKNATVDKDMLGVSEKENREYIKLLSKQDQKTGLVVQKVLAEAEQELLQGLHKNQPPEKTLNELQREISIWANKEFPDRTPVNTFMKLITEISELIEGGFKDPLEYADIVILVLDMAYLAGIDDPAGAVAKKMKINRQRSWGFDKISGTYNHSRSNYSAFDQEDDGEI